MAYYSREEQETHYLYDPLSANWRVYSTYPPHIRKLIKHADVTSTEIDEHGQIIAVNGYVDTNQIRLFRARL